MKQNKNKLLIPLAGVVLIIWGMIIINIIDILGKDEPNESDDFEFYTENEMSYSNASNSSIEIKPETLDRDPFCFPQTKPKNSSKKNSTKVKKEIPSISYNVNGVIINGNKKLVILEDVTNDKTVFLREGDTYENIKIKRIYSDRLLIIDKGKNKELYLSSNTNN